MRRAVFSLILIGLVGGGIGFGQSGAEPKAGPDAKKGCPFSIVGLWRSDSTTATNPVLYNFLPEGGVALLGYSADTLPQDFEIINSVSYKLDNPSKPKLLEFTAHRGNEAFPPGKTLMEIAAYSDDSFTTLDPASGQTTLWVREQTHRHFLTFAARGGTPRQGGAAFAMWTTLDGRQTKVEALGVQMTTDTEGNTIPVFGPIPAELYKKIAEENDEERMRDKDKKGRKDDTAVMRLELTAAEFERTHKVFEVWEKYVKTRSLPNADPYLNGMEFLRKAAEPLNRCDEKLKLEKVNLTATGPAAKDVLRQQPLEFIKVMRKKNEDLHVSDSSFPWGWQPMLRSPGQ